MARNIDLSKSLPHSSATWARCKMLVVLLALLSLSVGCQTVEPTNMIIAKDLPPELRATHRVAKPTIDLSALARNALNNNLIYPGDELSVTIVTGAESEPPEPYEAHVYPDGNLNLPVIGTVQVASLSLTDAEVAIRSASIERRKYRNPSVSVMLKDRKKDRVVVTGAVENPAVYELPRAGNDLLAALTEAGGLSEDASTVIEIRHPKTTSVDGVQQASFDSPFSSNPLSADNALETTDSAESIHVDLVEAMSGGTDDLGLRDGSVVWVKEHRPETIYVQGLVKEAGEFEIPKDSPLRVDQAIALAKGRTIEFADKIHVTRIVDGQPIVIELSMREAKFDRDTNIVLMDRDVVSVEETPMTFTVDFVRNFFRIGFSSAIPGF